MPSCLHPGAGCHFEFYGECNNLEAPGHRNCGLNLAIGNGGD